MKKTEGSIVKMTEMGKIHEGYIKEAKDKKKKWKPKAPIHICMFLKCMEFIGTQLNDPHKGFISEYLAVVSKNIPMLCRDVRYWRKIVCHDDVHARILYYVVPGTPTAVLLQDTVLPGWYLHADGAGGEEMQGVAPRSANERRLIKATYGKQK